MGNELITRNGVDYDETLNRLLLALQAKANGAAQFVYDANGNVNGLNGGSGNLVGLGKRVVFFGDSITANGAGAGGFTSEYNTYEASSASANIRGWASMGWQVWLMRLMGQPWYSDITGIGPDGMSGSPGGNQAVSSQTTYDMVARLANLVAAKPDVVFFHGGTNDLASINVQINAGFPHLLTHTPTMAGVFANFQQIVQTALSVASQVIVIGILPRNDNATNAKYRSQYRKFQKEYCASIKGVIYIDPWQYIVDPTSSIGNPLAANCLDGILHPSAKGAFLIAQATQQELQYIYPPLANFNSCGTLGDFFDATYNPYGNILSQLGTAIASASQNTGTGLWATGTQAFVAGLPVTITGTPPTGFAVNEVYFVIATGLTTTSCELSATIGGSVLVPSVSSSCNIVPYLIAPDFSGNTGTLQSTGGSGASTSGTVPTGWTFKSTNPGDQLVGLCTSAVMNGVTYNVCELTVTNTGAAGAIGNSLTFIPTGAMNGSTALFSGTANTPWATASNFVIGDRFYGECVIDIIDSTYAQQLALMIGMNDGVGSNVRRRFDGVYNASYSGGDGIEILTPQTGGSVRLKFRTPILTSLGIDTFESGTFAALIFQIIMGVDGAQATSKLHIRVWPPVWYKTPPQIPLFNTTLAG